MNKQIAKDLYIFLAAQETALRYFEKIKYAIADARTNELIASNMPDDQIASVITTYYNEMDGYVVKNKEVMSSFVIAGDPIVTTFQDKIDYYLQKNIKIN